MALFLSPSKSFCPAYFSERPEDKNRRKNYYYFTITIIEQIVQAFLIDYLDKGSEKVEIITTFFLQELMKRSSTGLQQKGKCHLKNWKKLLKISLSMEAKEWCIIFRVTLYVME